MRWPLATIVFWLTLSMGPHRISLDELPEMGLQALDKTFSDAWKGRVGEYQIWVPAGAIKSHRLRIDRDKEHIR